MGLGIAVTLSGFTVDATDLLVIGIQTSGAVPTDWALCSHLAAPLGDTSGSYVVRPDDSQRQPWPIGAAVSVSVFWFDSTFGPKDSLTGVLGYVWDPVTGLAGSVTHDPILDDILAAVRTTFS